MTAEIIEVKAMSIEEAKKRAMRVLGIEENQILNIKEKIKSKSFFGFFSKEGTYEVEYTEEKIQEKEEVKETKNENIKTKYIARDLRKERAEKLAAEKALKSEKDEIKKSEKTEVKKENIPVDNEKVEEILSKSKELIENMGLNLNVEFLRMEGKSYVINLSGEDKGIIIGKKGKTLNSFEYLLNSLIKDARIDIDVEGFKEKRTDTLVELANKMAMKAIKTKKVVRLNPMPPRERKIIHEIINQYPELDTFSEGRDPKRYIVIKRKK